MMFCVGFSHRHQRWAAGKGPLLPIGLIQPFVSLASALGVCLHVFRGTMPSRSHLTVPGAFPHSVANVGANRLTFWGTGKADQGLWRMGLVCLKRSITTMARVESAIEAPNGETVNGYKLEVTWVKFQKRSASKPRKQSNKLEAPNGNLEVVGNDVHEGLSDNSKTITQPLHDAHNRPIFVGEFPYQAPSCGSSIEDGEEVTSASLRPFDYTIEMDIQLQEKREMAKYSNKGKKSGNKNSRPIHNSPTPTEIAK
ncbi:hypothetical protein Cgig2_016116 [Carnegiea gigantea]|uniref:Uncharacterized protein n=1 Tax=Carnegiea gigantea TaxID=171969 RepID=A0A9Q1QMC1_9CARY|nr:hypothetical protein Cgig2_016116 [Carnegiea gigantea]